MIYIEHKKTENISGVVWIIAIWILYSQSKGLGFFLNINTTIEAGSLPDRYFLIALGILSLIIILQRHFSFTDLLKGNIPIVAILIYSLISVIWSRFPLISFRGWGREAVAFILALLLCSEKYPTRTLVSAFKKAIYTALPLSILLIKYYPAYGRIYGRWSGELSWVGIASQKNGLAEICALSALFLIWSLEKNIKNLERSSSILSILTDIFMVSLALYLMMGPKKTFSYSATSFLALLVGLFFYMLLKVAAKYKINIERFIMTFVIIILTMGVVIPFSGKIPIQSLPKYLNRSETLTGRTEIWNSLIPYAKQQIILGHGFGGFWTTSLRDQIASHSHNGYLNTILELGLIGLLLFYLFFIIVIKKSFILLKSENQISFLFISIILMILVRNISEVSIGNISNYSMWLLVVWSIIIGKRSNLMKAEESPKDLHLTVISDKY
ncbi:MAG: O-antigen ligase family protein [Candidatus Aminicenantes bacterium]|nr:O-antigen ligase family protein [Candidatus Aminicenantes bacterium]